MKENASTPTDTNGRNPLFAEFTAPAPTDWREAAEASLKGVPFEKALVKRTYEGIALQPIYTADDAARLGHLESAPGEGSHVRGSRPDSYLAEPWAIAQNLCNGGPAAFNERLLRDLDRGVSAVQIAFDMAGALGADPDQSKPGEVGVCGVSLATPEDWTVALDGVHLDMLPVQVGASVAPLANAALFFATARKRGYDLKKLTGGIGADPLSFLASIGTYPVPLAKAYDGMASLAAWNAQNAPGVGAVRVDATPYHEAGASAVQELAFALATGVEYLRALTERGLAVDTAAPLFRFTFAAGPQFFMEIAKLRAARLVWTRAVEAFGGSGESAAMRLHVVTPMRNATVTDGYVNLLRNSTEAFSAVLGGCDSLDVMPFDAPARPADDISRRISRNIQIVLQEECEITNTADPAGGSYYIESLTAQIAEAAWAIFQEVEKQGGMAKSLMANSPQEQCATTTAARASALDKRRDVLVGTNMYANLQEKPLADRPVDGDGIFQERSATVAKARPATPPATDFATSLGQPEAVDMAIAAAEAGATLGQLANALRATGDLPAAKPLAIQRLSGRHEDLRGASTALKTKTGHGPRLFLANMGPLTQHKLRADWIRGFFEVGGFEVEYPKGFATPEDAATAALADGSPLVVICSTDPTYPELVPPTVKAIKAQAPATTVLLAGAPGDTDAAFREAGLDGYVNIRSNNYAVLVENLTKQGAI